LGDPSLVQGSGKPSEEQAQSVIGLSTQNQIAARLAKPVEIQPSAGSQTTAAGLSGVETPPVKPLMLDGFFGARLAAGKSAVPAEMMPMGPGSVAYETAYARGMEFLMKAGLNAQSSHVVRFSLLEGKNDTAKVIRAMNLGDRKNFMIWAISEKEADRARLALGNAVSPVMAKSYGELKEILKDARTILTVGVDERSLAAEALKDANNQAAIIDAPMKKVLSARDTLTIPYLAGASPEKVLAIVGKQGATPELSRFLSFWKWSVRFLKSPFQVLSEIYKMIRQTEVAA